LASLFGEDSGYAPNEHDGTLLYSSDAGHSDEVTLASYPFDEGEAVEASRW
jgi:hypothetical protein